MGDRVAPEPPKMPIGFPLFMIGTTRKAGVFLMQEERWEIILGFGELYEVSTCGRIRNRQTGKEKATITNQYGHHKVQLHDHGKGKMRYIHRLVYEAFVGQIPRGYDVHHIDGNPTNNSPHNLELIAHTNHVSMHMKGKQHTLGHKRSAEAIESQRAKVQKAVVQYTLDGEYIATFPSLTIAEKETKVDNSSISRCCNGKQKQSGGFKWRFKD